MLVGAAGALVLLLLALMVVSRLPESDPGAELPSTCEVAPADGEAAVTAAVAACPDGSTVQFPSGGVYHQAEPIRVEGRTGLTIDGNGSTFVSTAPVDDQLRPSWMVIDGTDVVLQDMEVQGNFKMEGPRSLERMQQELPSGNHFQPGIGVYGGTRVTVRDASVRDTFGDGVLVAPSGILPGGPGPEVGMPRDVRLQRLEITRTARQGVAFTGGVGLWLEDSTIRDGWYLGVDLEIDVPGQPLQDVHIVGNTFDGTYFSAIALPWPGDGDDVVGIEIRGNTTLQPPDQCGPQISVNAYPDQQVPVRDVVIEDNHVLTRSRGIVYGAGASGAIRGNRIEKVPSSFPCGDPEEAPVLVPNSPAVVVSGNTSVGY